MSEERWTRDHRGLYLKGELFYPLIGQESDSWANAVMINLAASLQSDLCWDDAEVLAASAIEAGKWIVWNLDLDLSSLTFLPNDTTTFHSLWLSFEQFSKKILPLFEKNTLGVIVYQGTLDVTSLFPRSWWEPLFLESQKNSYLVFAMQLFSEYVHRLVSVLPDAIFPFVFFDPFFDPPFSLISHLLFHERFEHVVLGLKGEYPSLSVIGWESPSGFLGYLGSDGNAFVRRKRAKIAILLPEDRFWTPEFYTAFDLVALSLQQEGKEFCLISVKKLHEEWDEIDEIYVPLKEAISDQTLRKLQGFEATGGIVAIGRKS